jgi:hypothetical protein
MSAVTIEVPETLLNSLRTRAQQDGVSLEQKTVELLQASVRQTPVSPAAFHEQVEIAREELERFRDAFRELSR